MTALPAISTLRNTVFMLAAMVLIAITNNAQAEQFTSHALRGMHRFNVTVDGVNADFARYGLSAEEMRKHVEERLLAAGLETADDASAESDVSVSQLRVKLTAVESSYGFYSYAVALQARRKIPLSAEGGFVSQNVWSNGQSGISNPTDLRKLYPVVDDLMTGFLSAHGSDNVATTSH